MSCMIGPKISVTLQTVVRVADTFGTYTETWSDSETFKAIFKQMSSKDALKYAKLSSDSLFVLYCGAKKANNTARTFRDTDRVLYNSRTFQIIGIENPLFQGEFYIVDLQELR